VNDRDGDSIGHITDIIYHNEDQYSIVVNPSSSVERVLEKLNIRYLHEIVIPGNYINIIANDIFQLSIDRIEIEKIDALPIHQILDKSRDVYTNRKNELQRRYHYKVLQAPLYEIQENLSSKGQKLTSARSMLTIKPFDIENDGMLQEFVTLYNEVAITSVDPYEQLTPDKVSRHFAQGSYLAYFLGHPVCYCITTVNEQEKMAAIAGIGIHHKQRGKKFSSALMADMLAEFDDRGIESVQCDVLSTNEASLGLFGGLGFTEIDDFYLS